MRELPRGTVTFLFTDIEGSREAFSRHGGAEFEAQAVRDDPAFERGREEGRRLSLDEAVAYALGP